MSYVVIDCIREVLDCANQTTSGFLHFSGCYHVFPLNMANFVLEIANFIWVTQKYLDCVNQATYVFLCFCGLYHAPSFGYG